MGNLSIVVGPMFSGKSKWLIKGLKIAQSTGKRTVVLLPGVDTRSQVEGKPALVSHEGESWTSDVQVVDLEYMPETEFFNDPSDSLRLSAISKEKGVIVVEEVQFFPRRVAGILRTYADKGANIWAAGLLRDSNGRPWETTQDIMGVADSIGTLQATCDSCGRLASETRRKGTASGRILVGGADMYVPMCRKCWLG